MPMHNMFIMLHCKGIYLFFNDTSKPQCTLFYEATGSSGYYGVAIQIEDFATETSTIPLSSVPIQFLVLVYSSNAPCSSQPEFVGTTRLDQSCIGVPFNTTYHELIIVQAGGEGVR